MDPIEHLEAAYEGFRKEARGCVDSDTALSKACLEDALTVLHTITSISNGAFHDTFSEDELKRVYEGTA